MLFFSFIFKNLDVNFSLMKKIPKIEKKFFKNSKETDFGAATKKIVTVAGLSLALLASTNAISAQNVNEKIDNETINQIKLLKKNDSVMNKSLTETQESEQYTYHRSHYSHYSHRSHSSHYSHYSSRY